MAVTKQVLMLSPTKRPSPYTFKMQEQTLLAFLESYGLGQSDVETAFNKLYERLATQHQQGRQLIFLEPQQDGFIPNEFSLDWEKLNQTGLSEATGGELDYFEFYLRLGGQGSLPAPHPPKVLWSVVPDQRDKFENAFDGFFDQWFETNLSNQGYEFVAPKSSKKEDVLTAISKGADAIFLFCHGKNEAGRYVLYFNQSEVEIAELEAAIKASPKGQLRFFFGLMCSVAPALADMFYRLRNHLHPMFGGVLVRDEPDYRFMAEFTKTYLDVWLNESDTLYSQGQPLLATTLQQVRKRLLGNETLRDLGFKKTSKEYFLPRNLARYLYVDPLPTKLRLKLELEALKS